MKQSLNLIDTTELNLNDKLIDVNRVAKVMKGGKRLRFSALVVTGDGEGLNQSTDGGEHYSARNYG